MFSPEAISAINLFFQANQPAQPVQSAPEEDKGRQFRIDSLVSEAATMQKDIEDAAARCTSLERSLSTLQSESETLLEKDATPAMESLLVLVNRIESLHRITQDQQASSALMTYRNPTSAFGAIQARAPLVDACKSQSQVVFGQFGLLSEKARNLTQKFTELATEFTFETTLAQGRIQRLRDIVQVAATLRNGVENERGSWQDKKATAETHVQQARQTIMSAERKRDSMESARVVRNIFTLGLGEAFDLFDLNEEIRDIERTVSNAELNVWSCKASMLRATTALQRINFEVSRLNTLGDTVRAQETTLQASVTRGRTLRTRTINLTNASLDVSLFVGTLAAKSETFAVHHTAQEFARSVLSFGRLMVSERRLNGLLVQRDPRSLQETLNMIAQSSSENEDGRFIEAHKSRLAIEDLM